MRELAQSQKIRDLASGYLPGKASLVRVILFNKTEETNWFVTWHQDRTVAVSEKFEKENWQPWSIKDGIYHVQPPVEVLNQMVTFRIHLDNTDLENGCLKVLPNSHKLGILDHAAIQEYTKNHDFVTCKAPAGSALVMRPHILHSSSRGSNPSQRRILHLEYSSYTLPAGITWA
ncbi:phytanoyl-CoA dioxygenase family protein [Microbulbifer spongiae]|uniref:phytanoyl-CoA dioxygenase family protein n=1 Tax=Microbulbifer spongiae TaxID=2944933 RepID=UPI00345F0E5B